MPLCFFFIVFIVCQTAPESTVEQEMLRSIRPRSQALEEKGARQPRFLLRRRFRTVHVPHLRELLPGPGAKLGWWPCARINTKVALSFSSRERSDR